MGASQDAPGGDTSTVRWWFTDSLYPQATTSPRYIGEVALSRRHRYQFRLYLVRAYKPRIGRPKRRGPKKPNTTLYRRLHGAPWLLVATSLPHEPGSERRIKQIYTKRMQIEETFRDLKSHRWGFGLRYARCNTAKRLEILRLLGTLATLVAWLAGLAGRTMQWNWQLQANTTRKRQVLSTFFIGRQLLARPAFEIPPPILQLAFAAIQRDLIAAAEV